jgi:hypothetical protein
MLPAAELAAGWRDRVGLCQVPSGQLSFGRRITSRLMRCQQLLLPSVQDMKRGPGVQQREGEAEVAQAEAKYPGDDRTARRRAIEKVSQPCCACCVCCLPCLPRQPLRGGHDCQGTCTMPG